MVLKSCANSRKAVDTPKETFCKEFPFFFITLYQNCAIEDSNKLLEFALNQGPTPTHQEAGIVDLHNQEVALGAVSCCRPDFS